MLQPIVIVILILDLIHTSGWIMKHDVILRLDQQNSHSVEHYYFVLGLNCLMQIVGWTWLVHERRRVKLAAGQSNAFEGMKELVAEISSDLAGFSRKDANADFKIVVDSQIKLRSGKYKGYSDRYDEAIYQAVLVHMASIASMADLSQK
jgi:hypothetical protein